MSDDLVKRLRHAAKLGGLYTEAADCIENQEFIIKSKDSRIEELEEDLRKANL